MWANVIRFCARVFVLSSVFLFVPPVHAQDFERVPTEDQPSEPEEAELAARKEKRARNASAYRRVGRVSKILTWSMSTSAGNSREFAADYSVLGFIGGLRYRLDPQIAVGVLSGFNYFDDTRRATFTEGRVSYTATQIRRVESVPILATGTYHVNLGGDITPFASLGVGTYYTRRTVEAGSLAIDEGGWHFGLAPELGVEWEIDRDLILVLMSRFNIVFESGDSPDEAYFNFDVGIVFD